MSKIFKIVEKIEAQVVCLRSELDALDSKIEARDEKFLNRSCKWQEGEKGEEWEAKTEEIRDLHLELETEIETLESTLKTIKEMPF